MSLSQRCASRVFVPCALISMLWASVAVAQTTPEKPEAQPETKRVAWRFQTGQELKIHLDQSTEVSSSVDQRSQLTRNQMALWLTWRVESVDDDGSATIVQTIDRIRLKAEVPTPSGDQIAEFDTGQAEGVKGISRNLYKLVAPLVGTQCTLVVKTDGDIANVTIPEASMEILRNAPTSMQIRNVLTEQGVRELFGRSAMVLPEQDLVEEPEWTIQRELENGIGKFIQTQAYRAQFEDERLTITMSGQLEPRDAAAKEALVEFSSQATYHFDDRAGRMTDSDLGTTLRTKRPYRDLVINTTVVTKSTMTITENESPK